MLAPPARAFCDRGRSLGARPATLAVGAGELDVVGGGAGGPFTLARLSLLATGSPRACYLTLLPRTGREGTMARPANQLQENPLLRTEDLPAFSRVRPEHVEPAVDAVLAENRARLEAILAEAGRAPAWARVGEPLERMEERLGRVWSVVRHLHAVRDSEPLRAAYNACLPKLSDYHTELSQNETLYRAYEALRAAPDFAGLDAARRRAVELALRDFRLAGVALPPARKARFREIARELSELQARFEQNLLDATQAWKRHVTDPQALRGLPETALAMARAAAAREGLEGWLLNLEFPIYHAVVTYAEDRALRRAVYEAYVTRASDQGPHAGRWDNGPLMERILALRHEQARLLGFASYAEYALATRMAGSVDEVRRFLDELAAHAVPAARREFAELEAFARALDGLERLEAWDVAYYAERLRRERFRLSDEDLRPYFPAERVLEGLFALTERLFGVRVRERRGVDVWHPDVRFYELVDEDGAVRGGFYLDLYARPHKRGGAWMDEYRNRTPGEWPVAYLTCNLSPPTAEAPALFTHDEVQTLLHEFGHGLHHMLTRVDCPSVAGINGVEWDAVELPSQFLESFAWEREALDLLARHWRTGEPLPDELYRRLRASRTFHAAMQTVRQLEFALFDLRLHAEYDPARGARIAETLDEVRRAVAVVPYPAWNRFAHGFSHIFAGGYAAGYYSYKWAEVLSADAFEAFAEAGVLDRATGLRFRREVLEVGGARPAMASFVAFRGRPPAVEALLRQAGLLPAGGGEAAD